MTIQVDTYTPEEIAEALEVAPTTLRNIIRAECKANVPDDLRFVPGGRIGMGKDGIVRVYRGIFDSVTSGRAISHVGPAPTMIRNIHESRKQVAS